MAVGSLTYFLFFTFLDIWLKNNLVMLLTLLLLVENNACIFNKVRKVVIISAIIWSWFCLMEILNCCNAVKAVFLNRDLCRRIYLTISTSITNTLFKIMNLAVYDSIFQATLKSFLLSENTLTFLWKYDGLQYWRPEVVN